jgi:hypothetical protein
MDLEIKSPESGPALFNINVNTGYKSIHYRSLPEERPYPVEWRESQVYGTVLVWLSDGTFRYMYRSDLFTYVNRYS